MGFGIDTLVKLLGAFAPFGDTWLNMGQIDKTNARAEELAREAVGRRPPYASGQAGVEQLNQWSGMPGVSMGGQSWGAPGSSGSINLDDFFGVPGSVADAYSGARGGGYDFGGLLNIANQQLAAGRPGDLEAYTDAYQQKGLTDVSEGSLGRMGTATTGAISQALGQGKSLQEAQGDVSAIGLGEDRARASQGAGVMASAESMKNQTRLSKAQIEASLAQTGAGLASQIGLTEADQQMKDAMMIAQLTGQDINNVMQSQAYKWGGMTDIMNRAMQNAVTQRGFDWNEENLNKQIWAGVPIGLYQGSPFSQGFSNVMQAMAGSQGPKKSQSFGLTVKGTGGSYGSGCVDGDSPIQTINGIVQLRAVKVGDEVIGKDHKYHKVVRHDYGSDNITDKHVRIHTVYGDLVITNDHILEGKPAGDWKKGDTITVYDIPTTVLDNSPCPYTISGDLMLEDNVPYMVNGFIVHSMIAEIPDEQWNKLEEMFNITSEIHNATKT